MIRFFSALLFCACIAHVSSAQTPTSAGLPERSPVIDKRIKDAIVKMAGSNPSFKVISLQQAEAEYNVKIAKSQWADLIWVAGNLNEYNINKRENLPSLYPRYNVGVRIPLGSFWSIPNTVKKAKAEEEIMIVNKEIEQRRVKVEVLTAYEDYLMYKEQFAFKYKMAEEDRILYNKTEADFAGARASLVDYNLIYTRFNDSQTSLATARRNLIVAAIVLENMIGSSIEDVIARFLK